MLSFDKTARFSKQKAPSNQQDYDKDEEFHEDLDDYIFKNETVKLHSER